MIIKQLQVIVGYVLLDIPIIIIIKRMNIKKNIKRMKLIDGKSREKVNELGLDHKMRYSQIMITSKTSDDPKLLSIRSNA